jgi:hypothetical protein
MTLARECLDFCAEVSRKSERATASGRPSP